MALCGGIRKRSLRPPHLLVHAFIYDNIIKVKNIWPNYFCIQKGVQRLCNLFGCGKRPPLFDCIEPDHSTEVPRYTKTMDAKQVCTQIHQTVLKYPTLSSTSPNSPKVWGLVGVPTHAHSRPLPHYKPKMTHEPNFHLPNKFYPQGCSTCMGYAIVCHPNGPDHPHAPKCPNSQTAKQIVHNREHGETE